MTDLQKQVNKVLFWVKYVEFGGAMIVVFVVGLLLGEISEGNLERIASIFRQIAGAASIILGCAVVYLVQYDKRKAHNRIMIGAMAAVVVSNAALMFGMFIHPIVDIIVAFGGVLVLTVLLQIAIDGYNRCKTCSGKSTKNLPKK